MRWDAKYHGKTVPAFEELERLLVALADMACPICQRKMNWFRRDGAATVITLQHDDGGTHRLICLSCNTRCEGQARDTPYACLPGGRFCARCRLVKPAEEFLTVNGKPKTYCASCEAAYKRARKQAARSQF